MNKFIDKLTVLSGKFATNRFLMIIQRSFMMLLPITMIGSFASLFKGLNIGGYQAWIQSTPLYGALGAIYQFSIGFLALYIVFLVGKTFAEVYDVPNAGINIGLTALMCFLVITPYTVAETEYGAATLSTQWLGASGMFTAIIVACITGCVFKFCHEKKIAIKLPKEVPPMMVQYQKLCKESVAGL